MDEANTRLSREIKSQTCPVGVHVRRGDLKTEVFSYGKPASSEYFEKAVALFQEQEKAASFYFFSDEPEWVRSELIPRLQPEGCYRVVDLNGSDKGYMDLFLMAHCRHQITSKGTLGKYSALLGSDPRQITVLCDDETEYRWKELLQNPVFLP